MEIFKFTNSSVKCERLISSVFATMRMAPTGCFILSWEDRRMPGRCSKNS
jgi:hypothetical protein